MMDSLTTTQLLRDAQQFYSDLFQCLIAVIGVAATVIVTLKIFDSYTLNRRVRKMAREEAERVKKELDEAFKDFKVYVNIALAVTKFRDGKPSKRDLEALINQDYGNMSMETLRTLVYAIRYCVDCLDDSDYELAQKVENYVRPIASELNSKSKYDVYGALANQILMRTNKILTGEYYGDSKDE